MSRFIIALLLASLQWVAVAGTAHAQAAHPDEMKREEKLRAEAKEALTTLANLIASRDERAKVLAKLRQDLKQTAWASMPRRSVARPREAHSVQDLGPPSAQSGVNRV